MVVALAELFWVFGDIAAGPVEVLLGADKAIPVAALPKFAPAGEGCVNLPSGMSFQ